MLEGYLTADEAAAHLGVNRQTLYNLKGRPDFPDPIHVGRTPLWPLASLDAWRAKHPARAKSRRDSSS
jgi:predicted DNA-binding transcriptional regulator AlpA